ncbi:Multidrug resistance efflux pump [Chryseobacterium sp. RU37D]|uniref:HlyD family secretion protein n=1 Tax=Chryseobacterium sp. RU37D TaxID=1907397 RepID=UPI000953CF45|nr:biotin/lipoyl-binding protein [Chryseobacterium sp. RU37D]SIQ98943.1 Multidrug resistance efflux pump [Chryseobacterium sp. RU37D]
MLELILVIYAGICWLLIKKIKLIPWTFTTQVVVYSLPIFVIIALLLSLNYFCPITSDVRVMNRSVDITSQTLGRVKKVYVKGNVNIKKGDTLFVIDREPYLQEIKTIEAKLSNARALVNSYDSDINASQKSVDALKNQLDLANKRVHQYQTLVSAGAANKFDLDQAITNANDIQAKILAAQAQTESLKAKVSASYNGDNVIVAELVSNLEKARWNLSQTVVIAPADGYIPNMSLNEGAIIGPLKTAFVFIEKKQFIVGLFAQNELQAVNSGNEVEIAVRTNPGEVIKAKLGHVIDATSQGLINNGSGIMTPSGMPNTANYYPEIEGKLAATFIIEGDQNLTTGARGSAVIYSDHIKPLHLIRKVMVRINSKLNYLIAKLH